MKRFTNPMLLLGCLTLALLASCSQGATAPSVPSSPQNTAASSTPKSTPKSNENVEEGYSANIACQDLSTIYSEYFEEFEEFRYGPDDGSGWAPLRNLTEKAVTGIDESIARMRNGITWDSFAISSSLLSAASSYMLEILESAERGYFSPGRDLEALLREIDVNLASVANSACN